MKTLFLILTLFLVLSDSCLQEKASASLRSNDLVSMEVPDTIVEKSVLQYVNKTATWYLNEVPFSGFAVAYFPSNQLKEKFGVLNGKKQNESIRWFRDGHMRVFSNYEKGKLHGEKKIWSADTNHILIAQHQYRNGRAHGEQRKWYNTGELYKILHLEEGKEEGLQQAFRKNGDLYANYEARAGRIFGLKKAALCFSLEEESIQTSTN